MTAQIFTYKGNLGISIDMEDGKFLNDVYHPGQLGCVIPTEEVEISPDAKQYIKNLPREGGSFAPLMLTKHTDGTSSIGILGFGKVNLGKEGTISRDCDLSVLDDCKETEIEAPDDYKGFIDNEA